MNLVLENAYLVLGLDQFQFKISVVFKFDVEILVLSLEVADVFFSISVFMPLVHLKLIELILPLKGSNSISFGLLTLLSQHILHFLKFLLQKERSRLKLASLHL